MKTISELEVTQQLADLLDEASHEPIVITRQDKPDVALIAAEDLEMLRLGQEIRSLTRGKDIVVTDDLLDRLDASTQPAHALARRRALRDALASAEVSADHQDVAGSGAMPEAQEPVGGGSR